MLVYKFSSRFDYVGTISHETAIQYLYTGKALSIVDSDNFLRSPSISICVPIAIRMTRGKSVVPNVAPSSANIFQRDRHECQYCGSKNNLTVDHVIPLDHFKRKKKIPKGITAQCWENLTTACGRCNSLKDNKTLEESGMKLRRKPFKPTPRDLIDFDLLWEKIARLQNGGTS